MRLDLPVEESKLVWRNRLIERKPDVEKELLYRANGPQIPYVSEDCPEKYRPLAERLVALQVASGDYKREEIDRSDMYKIKDISKATGRSFKDVIAMLVKNDAYVNNDVIDARHIIDFLDEFDAIYERFYETYNAFPINVLSPEARRYLKNTNLRLSHEEKIQGILEIYRPELAEIKFDTHNYDALPKSRIVLSEQNIEIIRSELKSIAVGGNIDTFDGNIDVLFSEKYETYFKNLCAKLKLAGYTFDRFVNEHTKFTYTLCFKADILPAVKQMATHYYLRYGTTKGMTTRDPYLRYKVETAQNVAGLFTTKELFESFDIETDSLDNKNRVLSLRDLKIREKNLLAEIQNLYPDGVIQKGFASTHDKLYDELSLISRRLGFQKIDEYLADKGLTRIADKGPEETCIYLSERDLQNYDFLLRCKSPEDVEERLASLGIVYVGPYENLGIYRKLAYEGLDSTYGKAKPKMYD